MTHKNDSIFKYNNTMKILRRKSENKCIHLRGNFFQKWKQILNVKYVFSYINKVISTERFTSVLDGDRIYLANLCICDRFAQCHFTNPLI